MATKVTTKEIQETLVETMRNWQKIEDASVASTTSVIEKTQNPLIRIVMEIIRSDSQRHHAVQALIAASLTQQHVKLDPEELAEVWGGIEKHIELEKQMVSNVHETLDAIRGRQMLVQEYLLNYLRVDEQKHDLLLEGLENVKRGLYPYA